MKEHVRKIGRKGLMLGEQLVMLCKRIIKQIVFPGCDQKGNVLTSILLLFLELTALLIQFPWDFSIDCVKRWKHYNRFNYLLKKGVLIVGCFLFLLSSFEWTYARENSEQVNTARLELQTAVSVSAGDSYHYKAAPQGIPPYYQRPLYSLPHPYRLYSLHFYKVSVYLLHCNFRI